MSEIKVNVITSPLPPITGAALRAAQAADVAAGAIIARYRAASDRLSAALNTTVVDATLLAEGFAALAEWETAGKATESVVKRYSIAAVWSGAWPITGKHGYDGQEPWNALRRSADAYRLALVNAGVPCPEPGIYTPEFWRDAAARGC